MRLRRLSLVHTTLCRITAQRDEVAFIEPFLAMLATPFDLVGHSYRAAVALVAALINPGRVRALALYEPTLFSLVDAQAPPPNGVNGIRNAVSAAAAALDAGSSSSRLAVGRQFCGPELLSRLGSTISADQPLSNVDHRAPTFNPKRTMLTAYSSPRSSHPPDNVTCQVDLASSQPKSWFGRRGTRQ